MNLKLGFLRLWIVGVVLWVGVCGWTQFPDWRANWDGTVERQAAEMRLAESKVEEYCGATANPNRRMTKQCKLAMLQAGVLRTIQSSAGIQPPVQMATVLFGVPLGFLGFGLIISWIVRGFRRKGSPS